MQQKYFLAMSTDKQYFFGEDNMFYDIWNADVKKDVLYLFTKEEAEEVKDSLFTFDYESAGIFIEIIPENEIVWEED